MSPEICGPLSWQEARSRLRSVLERYVRDRPSTGIANNNKQATHEVKYCFSLWILYDLDLYAGSLLCSIALLAMTSTSLILKRKGLRTSIWNPTADVEVYKSQVAASVFILTGSVLSLWMVRRRRLLCLNDSDTAKRRQVLKFLKAVADEEDNAVRYVESDGEPGQTSNLSGTAQTDIYPVYRKIATTKEGDVASWNRIPSLLLVRDDYIALQIGDVVPANCIAVDSFDASGNLLRLCVGDRLSLDSFGVQAEEVVDSLPKGRTTLQTNSECLLTLCNNMQIFRVVDTPLEEFIRRAPGATQSSQISRILNDVRSFLSILSLPLLILSAVVVFSRTKGLTGAITLMAPLPILAALGILPVVGPVCILFLETIGTARILATVHPFSCIADAHGTSSVSQEGRGALLFKYMLATGLSRLALWDLFHAVCGLFHVPPNVGKSRLVRVPPASLNVLEKLGVATALALVDDELVCEPHSMAQQLLIPSGRGLKLLDLCPEYDDESVSESDSDQMNSRKRGKSFDSDSDSDDSREGLQSAMLRRKILRRRFRKKVASLSPETVSPGLYDVQFEEPNWWQHLPSLKCIGLACLLADGKPKAEENERESQSRPSESTKDKTLVETAKSSLVKLVCDQRRSHQLRSLAECIGFSTQANVYGDRGDISPFKEQLRLHVLSDSMFSERMKLDAHERSSEQSRWWGLIRPDATSVVVKDNRTQAHQLLTVGDPTIVTNLCSEAWQGEISTILPLVAIDKQKIIETANDWRLADLDVAAFCYSPVPHNLENRIVEEQRKQAFLLDHAGNSAPILKDKTVSKEWSLIRNQIFLGMLGSLVVPRREIQKVLDTLNDAGVRFVYFSPRNMRRQKELATQMGIDVAWNCAISLRPLQHGDRDPHRMVSLYADWDVNAKLPHGVDNVRKHLQEVDNVPLLVSLFTDVTKTTTQQMVEIFQDYSDTVVSIGLSHLPTNDGIFAISDIAVGIDVLQDSCEESATLSKQLYYACALPSELEFVSSIASHSCAFRFRGATSVSNISSIIEMSRASLESAIAAATFLVTGCISFSFYIFFSVCMPANAMTYFPMLGAVLYLQAILPCMSLAIAMTDGDKNNMKRVPPKNDKNTVFGRKEGYMLYSRTMLKALLPALLPQILHPIVYGELMIKLESELVSSVCPNSAGWLDVVRCEELNDYSGNVRISSGCVVFVVFLVCILVSSAGFVHRFNPIWEHPPWSFNFVWVVALTGSVGLVSLVACLKTVSGTAAALPWEYYFIAVVAPFGCLLWTEACKRSERKVDARAEKLRRLQFETRLGAWSPR